MKDIYPDKFLEHHNNNVIAGEFVFNLIFQVRHGPGFYSCDVVKEVDGNGNEILVVKLSEDDQGLAAGQYAAFYEGSTCIGSGVILESWDDQGGFPVCARALEIAKIKDISKLGKPVKIKCDIDRKEEEGDHK